MSRQSGQSCARVANELFRRRSPSRSTSQGGRRKRIVITQMSLMSTAHRPGSRRKKEKHDREVKNAEIAGKIDRHDG
jgi:hypothetical protein